MKIQLNQSELEQAIKAYVESIGIPLTNKKVSFEVTEDTISIVIEETNDTPTKKLKPRKPRKTRIKKEEKQEEPKEEEPKEEKNEPIFSDNLDEESASNETSALFG